MALTEAQRVGLTDVQRERFERDGYLIVEDALDPNHVACLNEAVDRTWAAHRSGPPVTGTEPLHLLAFVGRDPLFVELLDREPVLRLIVDLLGWNVFMYHCHLDVHPPAVGRSPATWMWHQDGGVQNRDLETHPRPRMSVKVAYFLSDVSEPAEGTSSSCPVPICATPWNDRRATAAIWRGRWRSVSGRAPRSSSIGGCGTCGARTVPR